MTGLTHHNHQGPHTTTTKAHTPQPPKPTHHNTKAHTHHNTKAHTHHNHQSPHTTTPKPTHHNHQSPHTTTTKAHTQPPKPTHTITTKPHRPQHQSPDTQPPKPPHHNHQSPHTITTKAHTHHNHQSPHTTTPKPIHTTTTKAHTHNTKAPTPQPRGPTGPEPEFHSPRCHCGEKSAHSNERDPRLATSRENSAWQWGPSAADSMLVLKNLPS